MINNILGLFINFFINIFKGLYLLKNVNNFKIIAVAVGLMLIVFFKQDINPTVRFVIFWFSIPISLNLICSFNNNESIKNKPKNEAVCINNTDNDNTFNNNYEVSTKVSHIERCTVTTKEVKEIIYFKGDN